MPFGGFDGATLENLLRCAVDYSCEAGWTGPRKEPDMTAIQISARTLTVGTITIDGFTVEYTPAVDGFGVVAVRGTNRDGAVEKRVWAADTLVPVLA